MAYLYAMKKQAIMFLPTMYCIHQFEEFRSMKLLIGIGTMRLFNIRRDGAVSTRVLGKVVAAHEPLVALGTGEPLLARVSPNVSL